MVRDRYTRSLAIAQPFLPRTIVMSCGGTEAKRAPASPKGVLPICSIESFCPDQNPACGAQVVAVIVHVKEPTGADCAKDYSAITPPVWGCGTPVVLGNVMGRFLNVRTAR